MIIYFDRQTGAIIGTTEGRIHTRQHLDMWIGEKELIDRIVINWKPVCWYDEKGKIVRESDPTAYTADYEPDSSQKELMIGLDKNPSSVYDYRVDISSKLLVKK